MNLFQNLKNAGKTLVDVAGWVDEALQLASEIDPQAVPPTAVSIFGEIENALQKLAGGVNVSTSTPNTSGLTANSLKVLSTVATVKAAAPGLF